MLPYKISLHQQHKSHHQSAKHSTALYKTHFLIAEASVHLKGQAFSNVSNHKSLFLLRQVNIAKDTSILENAANDPTRLFFKI